MWRQLLPASACRPLQTRLLSTRRTASSETISALKDLLGDRLSTSRSVLEQHGTDESYHKVTPPDAVAFVESTQEVSQILKVEPENMSCRVQAGVTRELLNTDLRATGLFFPVDPGANASIGGMINTNASGTTTVRYGNMKTNVMALTAVMADGSIIKTGSKTRKSSAGYDLTRLIIGSEGTLAVVTEAELRLFGNPEAEKTMICSFNTMKDAVETCAAVMQMGIPVALMELMDENAVEAINKTEEAVEWSPLGLVSQMPGSRGLVTDVAVPPSKLADVIVETQVDLKETGLFGAIVGHVGDGNFHAMIPFYQDNQELMTKVKSFSNRLVERALAYEGTCTGEHGIGLGKMNYLSVEHRDSVDVMHTIKKALDPKDIMNPGKMFYGNAPSY
ncbi:hypothetical protein PF005_g5059 [Phytophthora fragariae]|uniref:D-lactate dehydrogenase (cytochrome) n=1 Tax=Phytophthora fragariae TaxID=53985 RepID=A0A6A3UGV3_9STRA|nr:hypothetical protein PF010_g4824 [Phytophthora fragariae]KAE9129019.1 hypothetical protein PF007_g5071 [Phytophthora fragariae]KAE9150704.1 hypothetical protein PF006_g4936 [Phytophthora fragariae]KAE9226619.1 hypothetical protein PF005_g5059 [Phytophthora fragariae]KAE9247707.1 hypothetical protein PF004_g4203 [Phytophthora fragariae]